MSRIAARWLAGALKTVSEQERAGRRRLRFHDLVKKRLV
jgi:hypothetical protein